MKTKNKEQRANISGFCSLFFVLREFGGTMNLRMFQIDAFTDRLFGGNPAAVCPLDGWLDDAVMQAIAAENNLAETAFFIPNGAEYDLRWFTPITEMDLCGHATLASAWVVFNELAPERQTVTFSTRSGNLVVRRDGERLVMDFPAKPAQPCEVPPALRDALGRAPEAVFAADDYMAVFASEDDVLALQPTMDALAQLDRRGVIVTAPGKRSDFVSRFFAPKVGIPEDPVTGAAHCTLVPYWSARLGKRHLHALQVSARVGELFCEDRGERVTIAGHAVKYLEGTIILS
jgi:PhzF family phenazine biosynthesis protein